MGACREVITPGVKEVSSASEPPWFERQAKKGDEDIGESEDDESAGLRDASVPFPETKKEFSRERMRDYRSAVSRCNDLASERFEMAFATKELCKGMSNPTEEDMQRMKRMIRFLKGLLRMVQRISFSDHPLRSSVPMSIMIGQDAERQGSPQVEECCTLVALRCTDGFPRKPYMH